MSSGLIAWLMFSAGIGSVFGAALNEDAGTRIGAGAGLALILGSVGFGLGPVWS